jgi:hypothetical protein
MLVGLPIAVATDMSFLKRLFRGGSPPAASNVDPAFQGAVAALQGDPSPENFRRLYEVVLNLTLWVPTSGPVSANDTATIVMSGTADGNRSMMAFTDVSALHRWQPNPAGMLAMGAQELFEMAWDLEVDDVQINYAGPVGGVLTRDEVRFLRQGVVSIEPELPEKVQTMSVAPAETPLSEEGLRLVREVLSQHAPVVTGYRASLLMNDAQLPTLALAFAGESEEVFEETTERCRATLHSELQPTDLPLYVIPIRDAEIENAFRQSGEAIYER